MGKHWNYENLEIWKRGPGGLELGLWGGAVR